MSLAGEKIGVENLAKVVMLVVEMGNVADKMGRTKGFARWMNVMALADELAAMDGVVMDTVWLELKDLDAAEREQIAQLIREKFVIVDKDLEVAIESALTMIVDAYALVEKAIALFKELKGDKA